ncbi:hypothetical protein SEA_XKCD426_66 [Streptomyces phage Xkcd426]|nr:hypothetical protein SEA_XKCD426_66 [Streptomyces phage Xkcd426]
MKKLTKTQADALQIIASNPGRVVAWNRTVQHMIRINGNTENRLTDLGLIRTEDAGQRTYRGHSFTLRVWTLTDAGKAALAAHHGAATEGDAIEQMRNAARAEGRRMGLTDEQIERFIQRMS